MTGGGRGDTMVGFGMTFRGACMAEACWEAHGPVARAEYVGFLGADSKRSFTVSAAWSQTLDDPAEAFAYLPGYWNKLFIFDSLHGSNRVDGSYFRFTCT